MLLVLPLELYVLLATIAQRQKHPSQYVLKVTIVLKEVLLIRYVLEDIIVQQEAPII